MRYFIRLNFLVIVLIILQSCGGGNSTNDTSTQSAVKAIINLTKIPDTFTYDLDATQSGAREFSWEISFDINNDSIINEGDIIFIVSLGASDSTPQQVIKRSDMQAYWWEYGDKNPVVATRQDKVILTSTTTSFTFLVPTILNDNLNIISSGTQIFVKTTYRDQISGTYYFDYYPGKDVYTVGVDTGMLIDTKLDFETNTGPVSGVDYSLIDIESISVSIVNI